MSSKGFTLLEVITAIFILTVGIGASFSLIQQTLSAASLTDMRLTAAYLTQEGMEIVKNLRDKSWLEKKQMGATISWDEYLPVGSWEADYLSQDLGDRSYSGTHLYINGGSGFYQYIDSPTQDDVETKFSRMILVEDTGNPDIKRISVQVLWEERGRAHTMKVLENITYWYEQ